MSGINKKAELAAKTGAIIILEKRLLRTDYKEFKNLAGHYTAAEWKKIADQRQAWRDEINRLEAELENEND